MTQSKVSSVDLYRHFAKLKTLGLTFTLGIAGGCLAFCGRANAVERVRLIYETHEAVVSFDEIRTFAETGQPPAQIQQFLLDNGQPAEVIARLLTEEITLSENLRAKIRTKLEDSSIGQFVLYEIDKIIQGSGDLTALKVALDRSMEDRTISVLEILENYTGAEQVTVNLVGLRRTYTDVKAFVERVIPALEVAKEYLQGVICKCETPPESGSRASSQSQLPMDQAIPAATTSAVPCLKPAITTDATPGGTTANPPQVSDLNQSDRLSSSTALPSSQP